MEGRPMYKSPWRWVESVNCLVSRYTDTLNCVHTRAGRGIPHFTLNRLSQREEYYCAFMMMVLIIDITTTTTIVIIIILRAKQYRQSSIRRRASRLRVARTKKSKNPNPIRRFARSFSTLPSCSPSLSCSLLFGSAGRARDEASRGKHTQDGREAACF